MNIIWPLINRRYLALEPLGSGGTATVYRCLDLDREGAPVALKVFDPAPGSGEDEIRAEFETLTRLDHPHLARVRDFGRIESIEAAPPESAALTADGPRPSAPPPPPSPGRLYLAADHIAGLDLTAAFAWIQEKLGASSPAESTGRNAGERAPELPWRAFARALHQIALGLESIHALGIVHRDLHPRHLLVTPRGDWSRDPAPTLDAHIIDFGLAVDRETQDGTRIRGTLPFIAPEVLEGREATAASDLYALGLSILAAITNTDFADEPATPAIDDLLARLPATTPPALAGLIESLVQTDPARRPASAREVRGLLEPLARLAEPEPTEIADPKAPGLGWEDSLAHVRAEAERLSHGQPSCSLVLLETHEDAYQERLLEAIETLARLSGIRLFRGQCQQPSELPFQPLSEALTPLIGQLDLESPLNRRYVTVAAPVLPGLSEILPSRLAGEAEPGEAHHQIADALTELLLGASQESPCIILLDELQAADPDTLHLLEILARDLYQRSEGDSLEASIRDLFETLPTPRGEGETEPLEARTSREIGAPARSAEMRVLIIGVYRDPGTAPESSRTGEPPERPWRAPWSEAPFCQHVGFRPLSREECRAWVEWRRPANAPSLGQDEVDRLWELSQGLPRLLDQQIQQESGAPDAEIEIDLDQPEALPSAERTVLESLAVLPVPVRLDRHGDWLERRLQRGEGQPVDLAATLDRLVSRGALRLTRGAGLSRADWTRRSLRDRIRAGMTARRLRSLSREALEDLARRDEGGDASELASHLALDSGDFSLFLETTRKASDRYLRARSLHVAARLLEALSEALGEKLHDAGARLEGSESALLSRTLHDLATLYRRLEDHPRAIERFNELLKLHEGPESPEERARIYRLLGEACRENGDQVNANYWLEKAVRKLENLPPGAELIEALLALAGFHLRRGQLPAAEALALRALEALNQQYDPEISSRTCLLLGKIFTLTNNHSRSIQFFQRAAEGAREAQDLPRILEASQALGLALLAHGDYDKAIEQFSRGIELATLLQSKRSLARLYNHLGTIQFNRANPGLALENYGASLRVFNEIGDPKGIANCYNNIGLALCLRDDLTRAAECYRKAIEIFTRLNDQHGQAAGMNNLANILELQGQFAEALDYAFRGLEKRKRFKARSGIAFSHYRIGRIYQSMGELEKALAHSEKALEMRREIGEKMGIANSKVQLAELLLAQGKLAEAQRWCEEGEQEFKILENRYGRAFAREILSRIAIELGDLERATELLEDTLTRARRGEQRLLTGKALLGLGVVALEEGDHREAGLRLERAEVLFRENRSRRALTQLLLVKARLALELDQPRQANRLLNATYDLLEELGIRDLNAEYFLLRGRLEVQSTSPADARPNRFFSRAEVEARNSPTVLWKVHLYSALSESESQAGRAREHLERAAEILEGLRKDLGEEHTPLFYSTRERRLLCELLEGHVEAAIPFGATFGATSGATSGEAPVELAVGSDLPSRVQDELRELRHQNRRLLKLQEINRALNSELNLRTLLERILDAVLDLMSAERGFLVLRPTGTTDEEITIARNMAGETIDNPAGKISHSICEKVLREGEPVLSTSAVSDDRFVASKSVQDLRLLSVLCLPLKSGNETLGALYLDNRSRHQAFEESDLRVLESFCDQATSAIHSAHLADTLRKRNHELTELNTRMEGLNQRLLHTVEERTQELEQTRRESRLEMDERAGRTNFPEIVGQSPRILDLFELLERVAPTSLPVLICGESGTGKELVARAIHAHSLRKEARFISENCAALSDPLLESELFGHERGAFTGATSSRKGLFELAHGGTLFLDEVAEMSLAMQKKLLRVLQEGELRKVGGKDTVKIDVRILCAANRDLRELVKEGKFREDLYYRLNGLRLVLPPLRERLEDLPLLAEHFLREIARESNSPPKTLHPGALEKLGRYPWPGNVRELKHFFERTALLLRGTELRAEDCEFEDESLLDPRAPESSPGRDGPPPDLEAALFGAGPRGSSLPPDLIDQPLREARDHFTRYYVDRCYRAHDHNVTRAARACGMSRESFHRFLKKFDIKK